jgi:hypothetical protein
MRFPYEAYPVPGIGEGRVAIVHRPVVPVRVFGPNGGEELRGLVDSGADDTLLPDLLIEVLGVVIAPGDTTLIRGVGGGRLVVPFGVVDLELSKSRRKYRWSAKVGFTPGFQVILGNAGFLRHFTATLDGLRRRVTLKSNGSFPAPIHTTP